MRISYINFEIFIPGYLFSFRVLGFRSDAFSSVQCYLILFIFGHLRMEIVNDLRQQFSN